MLEKRLNFRALPRFNQISSHHHSKCLILFSFAPSLWMLFHAFRLLMVMNIRKPLSLPRCCHSTFNPHCTCQSSENVPSESALVMVASLSKLKSSRLPRRSLICLGLPSSASNLAKKFSSKSSKTSDVPAVVYNTLVTFLPRTLVVKRCIMSTTSEIISSASDSVTFSTPSTITNKVAGASPERLF